MMSSMSVLLQRVNIEGVICINVIPGNSTSNNRFGDKRIELSTITRVAPTRNPMTISRTNGSNVGGEHTKITSRSLNPNRLLSDSTFGIMQVLGTRTVLGGPVEPDVLIQNATSR